MTAPAINIAPASVPVAGGASASGTPVGATATGGGTGGGNDAPAGFEAVLATLFGQGPAATGDPAKASTKATGSGKSTNGGAAGSAAADPAKDGSAPPTGATADPAAAQLGQGITLPFAAAAIAPISTPDGGSGGGSTGASITTANPAIPASTPIDLKLAVAGGLNAGKAGAAALDPNFQAPPAPATAPVAPQPTDTQAAATTGQSSGPDIGAQLAALNSAGEQALAPSAPVPPGAQAPVAVGGATAAKDKASGLKLATADPTALATAGVAPTGAPKIADAGSAVGDSSQKSASDNGGAPAPSSETKSDPAPDSGAASADANAATASTTAPSSTTHAAATLVRGSPETVANLAAQILKKLDGRSSRFDVQLDPAGLGRVDVRVEIDSAGRMTAAMAFDNPQAAADVKARSNELQYALEKAGFDVSGGLSFDVSADPGQGGGAQGQSDNSGASFRGRAFQSALNTADDAAQTATVSAFNLRQRQTSGVDIRI